MKSGVQENARTQKPDKRYGRGIELTALLVAFILSVIGIGITEFRPLMSYRYWGAMTLILAVSGIVIGWARHQKLGRSAKEILLTQVVHWCATFAAVAGIYVLLGSGRLNYENTGLVVLLTLALATFLDGYRVSWSFGALGVMMFITSLLGAYIEQYIWVVLIMIICTAVVIVILEKASARRASVQESLEKDGPDGEGSDRQS